MAQEKDPTTLWAFKSPYKYPKTLSRQVYVTAKKGINEGIIRFMIQKVGQTTNMAIRLSPYML